MPATPSNPYPDRKRPIHQPVFDLGNRSVIVFVTVCTKDRVKVLANESMHALVLEAWRRADHWLVGHYVILPDHIHLFCAPNRLPPESLSNWVSFWKGVVAKCISAEIAPLWAKNFWDTQLRRSDSYAAKWEYVRNNAVRHGLVEHAGQWPYQGEMNLLRWHDA
jgi:putative transposase